MWNMVPRNTTKRLCNVMKVGSMLSNLLIIVRYIVRVDDIDKWWISSMKIHQTKNVWNLFGDKHKILTYVNQVGCTSIIQPTNFLFWIATHVVPTKVSTCLPTYLPTNHISPTYLTSICAQMPCGRAKLTGVVEVRHGTHVFASSQTMLHWEMFSFHILVRTFFPFFASMRSCLPHAKCMKLANGFWSNDTES